MPSLLSLPPNLRTTIFELALTYDHPLSLPGIYPDYHGDAATTTLTRTHLAPTQLNRQLRLEALLLFYSANTFAMWFAALPEEAVREIRSLRVYVACVTRWDPEGDELPSEREKFRAYSVGEGPTRAMTEHVLYDVCSGRQLFYEVEVESGRVEGFVETFQDGEEEMREGGEEVGGGTECGVCMGVLRRWVDSVGDDDEDKDGG